MSLLSIQWYFRSWNFTDSIKYLYGSLEENTQIVVYAPAKPLFAMP